MDAVQSDYLNCYTVYTYHTCEYTTYAKIDGFVIFYFRPTVYVVPGNSVRHCYCKKYNF